MNKKLKFLTIIFIQLSVCICLLELGSLIYLHSSFGNALKVYDGLFSMLLSDDYQRNEDLIFKLQPNIVFDWKYGVKHFTDDNGYRTVLAKKEKATSRYKILLLGDSCTFGLGVQFESTYGNVLEQLLKEKLLENVEVINMGVPGYSSFQCKQLLLKEIESISPDIVICYIGANDAAEVFQFNDEEYFHIQKKMMNNFFLRNIIKSNTFRLLSLWSSRDNLKAIKNHLLDSANKESQHPLILTDILDSIANVKFEEFKPRVTPRRFLQNIAFMRKLCKKNDSNFFFIPTLHNSLEYTDQYIPEPFVDIKKDMERFNPRELFVDSVHLTSKGHQLLAKRIFYEISQFLQ